MGWAPRAKRMLGLLPGEGVTGIVPSVKRPGGSNPDARPKLISTWVEVAGEEPRSTYAAMADEYAPQVTAPPTEVSVIVYDPRSSAFGVATLPQSAAVCELQVCTDPFLSWLVSREIVSWVVPDGRIRVLSPGLSVVIFRYCAEAGRAPESTSIPTRVRNGNQRFMARPPWCARVMIRASVPSGKAEMYGAVAGIRSGNGGGPSEWGRRVRGTVPSKRWDARNHTPRG